MAGSPCGALLQTCHGLTSCRKRVQTCIASCSVTTLCSADLPWTCLWSACAGADPSVLHLSGTAFGIAACDFAHGQCCHFSVQIHLTGLLEWVRVIRRTTGEQQMMSMIRGTEPSCSQITTVVIGCVCVWFGPFTRDFHNTTGQCKGWCNSGKAPLELCRILSWWPMGEVPLHLGIVSTMARFSGRFACHQLLQSPAAGTIPEGLQCCAPARPPPCPRLPTALEHHSLGSFAMPSAFDY